MSVTRGFAERRRVQRVVVEPPLEAFVAGLPMRLVDLSTTGARVEHESPLGIRREMRLRFEWQGSSIVLTCVVVRCRLERSPSGQGRGASYVSGLVFTVPDEPARIALRSVVASMLGAARGGNVTFAGAATGV